MGASIYHDYGSCNVPGLKDIDKPVVRESEELT